MENKLQMMTIKERIKLCSSCKGLLKEFWSLPFLFT